MKILYIASSASWGGASVALYNLIKGLRQYGDEVRVLFPYEKDLRFCDELDKIDVPYSFSKYALTIRPCTRNPLRYAKNVVSMMRDNLASRKVVDDLIRDFRPDIVHTNVGPLDLALSVCEKYEIPHVWHIREYQDKDFGMKPFPTKGMFIDRLHRRGNYNVAITREVFDYWNLSSKKDVTIYDGVFSESYSPKECKKDKIILFVGRVEPAKGIFDVFAPFSKFIQIYQDYKLVIAGKYQDGDEYYMKCKSCIENLCIADSVEFLGEVKNVGEWMSRAKAIVVSSRFEGFGFITAEAMINKCFVIGKNTAGTKEQMDKCLSETGRDCAFRYDDADSLLAGLCYVAENDTSELCELAQNVARMNYSVERHCSEMRDFYRRIINN